MRGMFLKHIVPSIAQALGLMLVIMSFVSPVPFHDSDISLVYIGPNVLDYPAAPNASAVPPKTVVAAEMSKASETNVRYRMGLLDSRRLRLARVMVDIGVHLGKTTPEGTGTGGT